MPALTAEQKETRRQRAEERKARRQERWEQEQADKAATVSVLREIRDNPEATTEQKIFAIVALDSMLYYNHIPRELKTGAVDLSAIREAIVSEDH